MHARTMATANDYKERGNAFYQRKQYDEAVENYTRSIDLDPHSNAAVYTNRSAAYFSLHRFQDSLEDAMTATRLNDKWVKGYYRQAAAHVALEQFDDAVVAYERGLEVDPSNVMIHRELADARKMRDERPRDHNDAKARGNECYRNGQYEDAVQWYSRALTMCPEIEVHFRATLLTNRAECYRQMTELKAVVRDCTDALALQPGNLKAHLRRALAFEFLEKHDNAASDFKSALEADPSNAVASEGVRRMFKFREARTRGEDAAAAAAAATTLVKA